MRRQDIQLLASVRQGNSAARLEVGRRYLMGSAGFPKHIHTGLDYLNHASVSGSPECVKSIAETLPLHEIVRFGQLQALESAARGNSVEAHVKLGLWLLLTTRDQSRAKDWLQKAALAGSAVAQDAMAALKRSRGGASAEAVSALAAKASPDIAALLELVISDALDRADSTQMSRTLDTMLALLPGVTTELADCVCRVLLHAQQLPQFAITAPADRIEQLIEHRVQRGSAEAALLLGRALCGIDSGPLRAAALASGRNLRKGAALLMRAADNGISEAWLHLYHIHADNHSSVSNPQMSRFFLEKAAAGGSVSAQRRLGALVLRSASSLHESEQGIRWLHEAAKGGDSHAAQLLRSLVLRIPSTDTQAADEALSEIRKDDPWMACRLQTARDFGLTKLEALSADLSAGARPWGLVVGPNPFISQAKLSAPRAIPALTPEVLERLQRTAAFFDRGHLDGPLIEGDLRRRSQRLRYLLQRHRADEMLFFADVRSTTLQSLRLGTKWAFRARQPLRVALAA